MGDLANTKHVIESLTVNLVLVPKSIKHRRTSSVCSEIKPS